MITVKLENTIISQDILRSIHEDKNIIKHELVVEDGVSLFVANIGIPNSQHAVYAKGIIYSYIEGTFTLVAMPFVKFYNSFENVCVEDLKNLEYTHTTIQKKQDGTLISRWVFRGKVYFSTRGNILTPDKKFYKPVMDIITSKYPGLLEDYTDNNTTYMFEYVGYDNIILELYPENDLIQIGECKILPSGDIKYYLPSGVFNTPVTTMFDNKESTESILNSMEGIQEGIVVNYHKNDTIIYRVKFKKTEYIEALKVKSFTSTFDPMELLIEHELDKVEAKSSLNLESSIFREELEYGIDSAFESEYVKTTTQCIIKTKQDLDNYISTVEGMNRGKLALKIMEDGKKCYMSYIMNKIFGGKSVNIYKLIYREMKCV